MGFIVKKLGGGISDNTPIKWKFVGRDGEFQSEPERFERNVAFWRNKLGTKAEVEILNKQIEEDEPTVSPEPAIESVVESNDSIVVEESMVPQSTEDTVDTPKPKRRKKASDV